MLTEFAQRSVSAVWQWFDAGLQPVKPTQNFENLVSALSQRADLLSFCADSLARFGTGVKQLELWLRPPQSALEVLHTKCGRANFTVA